MQTQSLNDMKKTLLSMHPKDLTAICVRLARFKKENKELLNYLLYEADDETQFLRDVQHETDLLFDEIRFAGAYQFTKQVRKILRFVSKHIRYSGQPATEAELLLHFCRRLQKHTKGAHTVTAVSHIYARQLDKVAKVTEKLHEDLRYDYLKELEALRQASQSAHDFYEE